MRFRRLVGKLHLWLGLPVGIVVFVIAVTGCIYTFHEEIENLNRPWRFVENTGKQMLPPSVLQSKAENELPGKHLHSVKYNGGEMAAEAIFYNEEPLYYYSVFLNQYNSEVLKVNDNMKGFFRFILNGHFYFWLPPKIGQPFVAISTLVFIMLLLTGIVLWFPRNIYMLKYAFSFVWRPGLPWKRKNLDLHSIVGFYTSFFALILALTGLVWGFQWFASGLYKAAGGEKSLVYADPGSTTAKTDSVATGFSAIDEIWVKMMKEYPNAASIEIHPPETALSSVAANANLDYGTYWKTDYRYFDLFTLKEIEVDHIYGRLDNAGFADKMFRMNYDIHVGAIGGIAGKILVFLIGLVVASLPVTGFIIWWVKRY
ncbi:MAG TPA: peptidase M4 [Prolixibacteraceae bacterium]|nr:peptidase M4 [Prolixibacteraceae bacterium]